MARPTFRSVDDYLAAQPDATRAVLEAARATIRTALPRAEEGISYGIVVYKLDGAMVLYLAGFKRHYAIYPATPHLLLTLKKDLTKRLRSKATIGFSYEEPVPKRLIARIAKVRAAEAAALGQAKKVTRRNAG